jgi:hypothetical protein
MDKLRPTGQNLGQVFYFRYGRVRAVHFLCEGVKLPNLKLKTRPKASFRFSPVSYCAPRGDIAKPDNKANEHFSTFLVRSFVRMIINVEGIKGKYVGQCKTEK